MSVYLRSGRHPHELLILVAVAAIGVLGVIVPASSNPAIYEVFGQVGGRLYFAGMAGWALVTVGGIWHGKIEGLLVERVGLVVTALFFLGYGTAIVASNGMPGIFSTVLPICLTVANAIRIWQIKTDLARLRAALRALPVPGDLP